MKAIVCENLKANNDAKECSIGLHSNSGNSETEVYISELQEFTEAVDDSISSLFKLSVILRNANPVDRFAKARPLGYMTQFDVDYVRQKFPEKAREPFAWLIERLGVANTRRREYIRYREEHRRKLASVQVNQVDKLEPATGNGQGNEDGPPTRPNPPARTLFPRVDSRSGDVSTAASTYVEREVYDIKDPDIEEHAIESRSVTSFATSEGFKEEGRLRIPQRPNIFTDREFECPFCFAMQIITTDLTWKYAFPVEKITLE